METGWRHDSHEVQREFERIRRQSSTSKTGEDAGAGGGIIGTGKPPSTPPVGILGISGAIQNELASAPVYLGFRLKSLTIDVSKELNAADRLFVFKVERPLTVEHNEVEVADETSGVTNTVRYIDFKDNGATNGITWTVARYDETKIQVSGIANVPAVCVFGRNIGTHTLADPNLTWYVDTVDESGCKILEFKKFRVSNDLVVVPGGTNAYIFDVNVLGYSLGDNDVYVGKIGSTLQFRGITSGGSHISISTTDDDIVINTNLVAYSFANMQGAEHGAYNKTTGTDPKTVWFNNLAAGTGISISDDLVNGYIYISCTVTDTNTTYSHKAYSVSSDVYLRLHGSDSTDSDIKLASDDGTVIITRVSDGEINFRATGGGGGGSSDTYDGYNLQATDGRVFKNITTSGSVHTFNFRTIVAGSGITVTENANNITIACSVVNTDTTYQLHAHAGLSANQARISLEGSDSSVYTVTLIGGSGISLSYSGETITVSCSVVDTNTVYDHKAVSDTLGAKLRLHGSDATNDDVLFKSGTNISITYVDDDTILVSCTATDTNTTYTYYSVPYTGGATLRLHGSDGTNNDVNVYGGGSTTVTWIDAHNVLISSTYVDTNNLYDIDNCSSGTGTGFIYHDNTVSGSLTTFHLRTIKAGSGITVSTSGHDIIISCSVVDTNDTYSVANVGTGAGKIWRDTTDAGSAHTHNLKSLLAGTNISITNGTNEITISCTLVDTNTTYDTDVVNAGGVYLRLNGSDSTHSNTLFTGSGGITVSRVDAHTINIACTVVDTNTTYSHNAVSTTNGAIIRLHGSDSTDSDVKLICDDGSVTITRTASDTIKFSVYTGYAMGATGLSLGGTEAIYSSTSLSAGVYTLKFRGLTAGTNIYFSTDANSITIHAWSVNVIDVDDCFLGAMPYSFLIDYTSDSGTHTKTARFRRFNVTAHDLVITECASDYIFDVNILGVNLGGIGTYDVLYDKVGSTFRYRSLKAGANVTLDYYDVEDPFERDIIISASYVNTTYDLTVEDDEFGAPNTAVIRLTGSDSTQDNVEFVAGTGVSISHHDNIIEIGCTVVDTYPTYTFSNGPAGAGTWYKTTGSYPTFSVVMRGILNDDGYLDIYASGDTIHANLTHPFYYYAVANLGSGIGVYYTYTGTGAYGDPYIFKLRSFIAGRGIILDYTANDITIKTKLSVGAQGLGNLIDSDIIFYDSAYGISVLHDTLTAGTSKLTPIFVNYNTRWDRMRFIESGSLVSQKTLAPMAWEKLSFDNENINDMPNWVVADTSNAIPWHFINNDDSGDCNYLVTVQMYFVTRNITDNTIPATIWKPQIALFIGDVFYSNLDIDLRVGEYALVRERLFAASLADGSSLPESGSKSFLTGTDIVRLAQGTDKLNVRFKHRTVGSRIISISEGRISITKVGTKGTAGSTPTPEVNYDLF